MLVGPGEGGDLSTGVVDVVVAFDVVPRVIEQVRDCIADDRVARAADVDRTSRVGAGVFDDDARLAVRKRAVVVVLTGFEGSGKVLLTGPEVQIGALRVDAVDVLAVVGVEGLGNLGGDLWGRCTGLAGEAKGSTRCEDGIDVVGWLFDAEIVGRVAELVECRGECLLDRRAHREEHTSAIPAGCIWITFRYARFRTPSPSSSPSRQSPTL